MTVLVMLARMEEVQRGQHPLMRSSINSESHHHIYLWKLEAMMMMMMMKVLLLH